MRTVTTINEKRTKMAKNNTPEEGNTIDQLNSHLTDTGKKIEENKKVIGWVIGGVVAAGLLVAAYFYFFHVPGVDKAFNAYGSVELNQAANDTVAAEAYKKVADQYSGSDAGRLAALEAAEHYYEIGKYKEALTYLEKFKTSDDVLKANVEVLKGDCYVNLKQYDNAISAFENAVKEAAGNDQIAPRAMMKEGVVYEAQKKYDKALEVYEQIAKEYPSFMYNGVPMEAYVERARAEAGK